MQARKEMELTEAPEAPNGNIITAIHLGWKLAEAFHSPPPAKPAPTAARSELPANLPGVSALTPYQTGQALLEHIRADIRALAQSDPDHQTAWLAELEPLGKSDTSSDLRQEAILNCYIELLQGLPAVGSHLGAALGLGRMLADTVLMANTKDPKSLLYEFRPERLWNAYGWLEDLHRELPAHASDAVSGSLHAWEGWVATNRGGLPAGLDSEAVTRALHAQGRIWERLLCGEKAAEDMLTKTVYGDAGGALMRQFSRITGKYLRRWWPAILLLIAVLVALVWLIHKYVPAGASSGGAYIATAAAALGVSWKSVSAVLGRALTKAEAPLWAAEIREAIVKAGTLLPGRTRPRSSLLSRVKRKTFAFQSTEKSPASTSTARAD